MRAHLFAALVCAIPLPAFADRVTVFAAASLKTALDEIAEAYEADSGHDVVVSYAGSGQLARQIIAGAPADLFLSANPQWLDVVQAENLVVERRDLLGNRLVLIAHDHDGAPVPIGPDTDLHALLAGGKLAMALVDAVPAGQYGKAALEYLGQWDSIRSDVAQADNVRAALALVATGEAPLGIVYETDALADGGVSVIGVFPTESHPPVIYPAALLTGADDPADREFFDVLSGPASRTVFEKRAFTVLD